MISPTQPSRTAAARRPDGQILVIFSLSLVALLAIAGLVVDLGGAWAQVRTEQKAADVAALAGATAEANGADRATIIATALGSASANGFAGSEVSVNIPPLSGVHGPGGAGYSANDCSTPALYPCFVEVSINRPHANSFSRVVGLDTFAVSARGVAVGGIANTVTYGASPLMFNYDSVKVHPTDNAKYCDPQPGKCEPNSSWPLEPNQFAWTTYCLSQVDCNVNSDQAKAIIAAGGFQFSINLNMYLGPHNQGQKTAVCDKMLSTYPNGGDLPVSINDDNGNLVGLWMWHLDTANSDCNGTSGEVLSGWFVTDITATLPLTITAGGGRATFGKYVVRLVE